MKILATTFFLLVHFGVNAQKPKNGTYRYEYFDLEYNRPIDSCKIVIKNDSILVFATSGLSRKLTNLKAGDLIEKGLLMRHKTGQWIIAHTKADARKDNIYDNAVIDFQKRKYSTY